MKLTGQNLLLCHCEGSMPLDISALAATGAVPETRICRDLCRGQLERLEAALDRGEELMIACTQEAPLFLETAEEAGFSGGLRFVNIREKAGWAREAGSAGPKIAALLAEAALDLPPSPGIAMTSDGDVLILGNDQQALDAALRLAERLHVTLLLEGDGDIALPRVAGFALFNGRTVAAEGHLGAFSVDIADMAAMHPSSRHAPQWQEPRRRQRLQCDLILDLRGTGPLFPAPEKIDGYFRPDKGDPAQIEKALFDLADMVGEFEKPRYVQYDADICAHGSAGAVGCSKCIDICPAGAVQPDGEKVRFDPYRCAGCGGCTSLCPTGAASYALPGATHLLNRLRTLLSAYAGAGGRNPVLLVHDTEWGEDMIAALARYGDGLPANVLPFAVNAVTQIGLDFLFTAFAYGTAKILLMPAPAQRHEADGLRANIDLVDGVLAALGYGQGLILPAEEDDPDALSALLAAETAPLPGAASFFLPSGDKRTIMRMALMHLNERAPAPQDHVAVPEGAPFGTVIVDAENCTLCLACTGACPVNALRDNPDHPRLSFVEEACIQCGLCRNTCPEKVITLQPRLNLTAAAREAVILKEEEPFACLRCGKPFGVRATIETMIAKLAGHAAFADEATLDRLKMCADCRVIDMAEQGGDPFAGPPRPAPRTTDDYRNGD